MNYRINEYGNEVRQLDKKEMRLYVFRLYFKRVINHTLLRFYNKVLNNVETQRQLNTFFYSLPYEN